MTSSVALGLAYADGHVDVYDHRTSPTGEAADMPVAGLLGMGWPELIATMGAMPVVDGGDIVVLGARDEEEAADIGDLPERLGITVYGPRDITPTLACWGRRRTQDSRRRASPTGCTSTSTYSTRRSSPRPII